MFAFTFRYSANDCGKFKYVEILSKFKKYIYAEGNETT